MNLPRLIAWRYIRRPTDKLVSAVGLVSIFGLTVVFLALSLCSCRTMRTRETGFLNRDGYMVYVPRDFDPARAWPVILFLHGAGERGTDGLRPTQIGMGAAIRSNAELVQAIVVFPQ